MSFLKLGILFRILCVCVCLFISEDFDFSLMNTYAFSRVATVIDFLWGSTD